MIKRLIFCVVAATLGLGLISAQTILTAETHGFRVGDSHDFIMMKAVEEGPSGADVIWDFTSMEINGKNLTSHMLPGNASEKTQSIPGSNFVLEEFGNHFVFTLSPDRMEQCGAVSCNLVTRYDKPFLKLKFPMSYGDRFSGPYSGTHESGTSILPVSGYYFIEADAYGTLLLPGNIEVNDVLRVKQTRTIQNPNGTQIYELTFRWYAQNVRYPVLVVTKYVYPEQTSLVQTAMYAQIENHKKSISGVQLSESLTDLNIFPNPYEESITISYNLQRASRVKIELYNESGKLFRIAKDLTMEEAGSQSLTLNGDDTGSMPGVLYVRLTCGNHVYTKKLIKL